MTEPKNPLRYYSCLFREKGPALDMLRLLADMLRQNNGVGEINVRAGELPEDLRAEGVSSACWIIVAGVTEGAPSQKTISRWAVHESMRNPNPLGWRPSDQFGLHRVKYVAPDPDPEPHPHRRAFLLD